MLLYGVLFAVGEEEIKKLRALKRAERPVYVTNELDELYFEDYPERTFELDSFSEAIHRALNGGGMAYDEKNTAGLAILGGEELYFDDKEHDDFRICLKTPEQVKSICEELCKVTEAAFKRGYRKIDPGEYPRKDSEDMEEAFEYFADSLSFWRFAAKHSRYVLFTSES